jgi:hypothetical protein
LTLSNDTFSVNISGGFGGGLSLVSGSAGVIGRTFSNKTAAVEGGGISNSSLGILSVGTSDFTGSTPDDLFGAYIDLGANAFKEHQRLRTEQSRPERSRRPASASPARPSPRALCPRAGIGRSHSHKSKCEKAG